MILRVLLNLAPEQTEYTFAMLTDDGTVQQTGVSDIAGLPLVDSIILVVPAACVTLTTIRLPPAVRYQSAKFEQLLPAAVEDSVLTDINQLHISAGPAISEGLYPVAIVDKEWLRPQIEAFQRTDRPLTMIVPEPLFGELDAETWQLTLRAKDGILRTGPSQALMTDRPENEAPIGLALLLKQADTKPEKIQVVVEEGPSIDTAAWSTQLDTTVELRITGASSPAWANRMIPSLNMATGEFAQLRRKKTVSWKRFRLPLFLAAALLILVFLDVAISFTKDLYTRSQLRSEIQDTFEAAFPDIQNEMDPVGRMTREIVKMQHRVGELNETDFLPMLSATSAALSQNNINRVQSLAYQAGSLTCQLGAVPQPAVDAVVTALDQSGYKARADFSTKNVTLHVTQ